MLIRQINLDHRTDRWEECIKNHVQMGFSPDDVARISACHDKDFGSLGRAKSHIWALSGFYTLEKEDYVVVIEDDFYFTESKQIFLEKLQSIRDSGLKWDVLMLAGTNVISYSSEVSFLTKVFESNTASGYIVSRRYAPTLLACFLNAAQNIDRYQKFNPADVITSRFSIDTMWKPLQRRDDWYMFSPPLGIQRPSFSDTEQRFVDCRIHFAP